LKKKISKKDLKDWENFLSNKETLPDKDSKSIYEKKIKTKSIDLHGYSLEAANEVIEKFIINSHKEKIKKLIVVTGKGLHSKNESDPYISKELGILRYSVPNFIKNKKDLIKLIYEIKEAKIEDGGAGAFYIYLKK